MKELKQSLNQSGQAGLAGASSKSGPSPRALPPRPDPLMLAMAEVRRLMRRDFAGLWESRPRQFDLAINEAAALAWLTEVPELVFPSLAREKIEALAQWHCRQESLLRPAASSAPAALREVCSRARVCPAEWPAAPCRQAVRPVAGRWDRTGHNARLSGARY